MTVTFVDDADVTNDTAGTLVTVSKPLGTVDGHVLVAFVGEVGAGSITPPAGWTLVASVAAGTDVTLAAYRKVASSEGASWTWTLGASVRSWGWVGAYSGVDTTDPIHDFDDDSTTSSGTDAPFDPAAWHVGGVAIGAVAGTRTASGSATTWTTGTTTERADLSTDGGAGTDIAGAVGDRTNPTNVDAVYFPTFTASQAQAQMCGLTVTLMPAWVDYNGGLIAPVVQIAWGADPDGDPDDWVWTDESAHARGAGAVVITKGRADESGRASPTQVRLSLLNFGGRFSPELTSGPNWPNVVLNTPLMVAVPYGYDPPTARAVVFVDSWSPRWWDTSLSLPVVDVVASGRLRRLQAGQQPIRSAIYRTLSGVAAGTAAPAAYWPLEDGSDATRGASAVAGVRPMVASGTVTWASDASIPGSDPLPTIGTDCQLVGRVPSYVDTGQWCAVCVVNVPASPVGDTTLLEVRTTGTARKWIIYIDSASPDNVGVRAFDSAGTNILDDTSSIVEADFYGRPVMLAIGVRQSGANVDYFAYHLFADGTVGSNSATLAGRTHGAATTVLATGQPGLDGATVGHFALWTTTAFDVEIDPPLLAAVLLGHAGETPWQRFQRLCDEEGIPRDLEIVGDVDDGVETLVAMGPQPSGTLAEALHQCEDTDFGMLHDGADGSAGPDGAPLVFVARNHRYNRTVAMTIDAAAAELAPGFAPEFDDARIANDVVVARSGGSSERYVDDLHVAVHGRYQQTSTLSLRDDHFLRDLAGWRTNLGTAPGLRHPQVRINLRRSPGLTQAWMASQVGSRVAATGLPAEHPGDIDAMLEGFTETIATDRWDVALNLAPASPYTVAVLESGSPATELVPWGFPVFVAAGIASEGSNASRTPALPAGWAEGDLLLVWTAIRNSGTGTPDTPAGWELLVDAANARLFGRVATSSESAPTITYTGGVVGATNHAQMAAFRGMHQTITEVVSGSPATQLNASAQDVAIPALAAPVHEHCLILRLAWKQDDWTSAAGSGTEIAEVSTTTGDDAAIWWGWEVQTRPRAVAASTLTVTGGGAAISRAAVVALRNPPKPAVLAL